MATPEQDALQDLAYAEAEGPADIAGSPEHYLEDVGGEDEFDPFGGEDEFDPFGESVDGSDSYMADAFGENQDQYLGFDGGIGANEAEDTINRMLGQVLGIEDESEALEGLGEFLKTASSVVGKVARGVAPVLSALPIPQAQAAGAVANLLGKLRAEGATTGEALEAVAELTARGRPVVPAVAGLAARDVLKGTAPRMMPAQRQQAAKALTRAATMLIRAGGVAATRALPKLVASVNRTAAANGTPVSARPMIVLRAAARLAQNPQALQRLSASSPRARQILSIARNSFEAGMGAPRRRGGGRRRQIKIVGPATLTITPS
jgi:hypothetical protein